MGEKLAAFQMKNVVILQIMIEKPISTLTPYLLQWPTLRNEKAISKNGCKTHKEKVTKDTAMIGKCFAFAIYWL